MVIYGESAVRGRIHVSRDLVDVVGPPYKRRGGEMKRVCSILGSWGMSR